jgi:hypothetical protein
MMATHSNRQKAKCGTRSSDSESRLLHWKSVARQEFRQDVIDRGLVMERDLDQSAIGGKRLFRLLCGFGRFQVSGECGNKRKVQI